MIDEGPALASAGDSFVPRAESTYRTVNAVTIVSPSLSHRFTAVEVLEKLAVPASWYRKVAARRTAMRVLAMTTPGHSLATLDGKDRHDPDHGRMKNATETDHQTAPGGQRRQARAGGARAPAGPPRPDIVRAKQMRRPSDPRLSEDVLRAGPGAGISA